MGRFVPDGRLIYGGSFNPLHIGHMRLALECLNFFHACIDHIEFLPSAHPPHKAAAGVLPFELRKEMIEKSIAPYPQFSCNAVEAEREEPSYTYKTLRQMGEPTQLFFLLGSLDFALLPTWWKGSDLPEVCNLVIVPREEYNNKQFLAQCKEIWPEIEEDTVCAFRQKCFCKPITYLKLPSGTHIYYLPLPYLDISASRIRQLWLCNKNLDYLVPEPVLGILNREKQVAYSCWTENSTLCSR